MFKLTNNTTKIIIKEAQDWRTKVEPRICKKCGKTFKASDFLVRMPPSRWKRCHTCNMCTRYT